MIEFFGPMPWLESITWRTGLALVLTFTLISSTLTFLLISKHLKSYSVPRIQKHIIRLIFIAPFYSISSSVAYVFLHFALPISLILNLYEGFLIYTFMRLFLEYLGEDESYRMDVLTEARLMLPPPACCFTFTPKSNRFLNNCRLGVLQFLIARIGTTTVGLAIICYDRKIFDAVKVYWAVINSATMALSMFSLLTFYLAARKLISPFSVSQFLSIKTVIVFNFWLPFISGSLDLQGGEPYTKEQAASLFSSLVITGEMAFAAIWHQYCFTTKAFIINEADLDIGESEEALMDVVSSLMDVLSFKDVVKDIYETFAFLWYSKQTLSDEEESSPLIG